MTKVSKVFLDSLGFTSALEEQGNNLSKCFYSIFCLHMKKKRRQYLQILEKSMVLKFLH